MSILNFIIKQLSIGLWGLALLSCSTEPVPPQPADRAIAPDPMPLPGVPAPDAQAPEFPALSLDYRPQRGYASLYGLADQGALTRSGEPYDLYAMTAAHPYLPLGIYVRVSDLQQRRSVVVRINDRNRDGAALRLSYQPAKDLGLIQGAEVMFQVLTARPTVAR